MEYFFRQIFPQKNTFYSTKKNTVWEQIWTIPLFLSVSFSLEVWLKILVNCPFPQKQIL